MAEQMPATAQDTANADIGFGQLTDDSSCAAGLLGSMAGATPAMSLEAQAAQQRFWHIRNCAEILLRANQIQQDAVLMKEITAFLQKGRDEITDLLDQIEDRDW